MAKFEIVSKYNNAGITLPIRKTAHSAGYDIAAAEDINIPSYSRVFDEWSANFQQSMIRRMNILLSNNPEMNEQTYQELVAQELYKLYPLKEINDITKKFHCRPTLIPTGIKCKLDDNQYLELSVRSSSPLKYWIVLANGVGIIDADYYNNPDNEGHIFFQVINLSPFNIEIKKGDILGQAIIKHFDVTEDDVAGGDRVGGFGSTNG